MSTFRAVELTDFGQTVLGEVVEFADRPMVAFGAHPRAIVAGKIEKHGPGHVLLYGGERLAGGGYQWVIQLDADERVSILPRGTASGSAGADDA